MPWHAACCRLTAAVPLAAGLVLAGSIEPDHAVRKEPEEPAAAVLRVVRQRNVDGNSRSVLMKGVPGPSRWRVFPHKRFDHGKLPLASAAAAQVERACDRGDGFDVRGSNQRRQLLARQIELTVGRTVHCISNAVVLRIHRRRERLARRSAKQSGERDDIGGEAGRCDAATERAHDLFSRHGGGIGAIN